MAAQVTRPRVVFARRFAHEVEFFIDDEQPQHLAFLGQIHAALLQFPAEKPFHVAAVEMAAIGGDGKLQGAGNAAQFIGRAVEHGG